MGMIYHGSRNPQGCGCCGCIVALLLGILLLGMVMALWSHLLLIGLLAFGLYVGVRYLVPAVRRR